MIRMKAYVIPRCFLVSQAALAKYPVIPLFGDVFVAPIQLLELSPWFKLKARSKHRRIA
eukprot:SAG11_NODE_3661_length_2302_cov_1.768044_2_plen_59_part_00